jgi:hypothetical protein
MWEHIVTFLSMTPATECYGDLGEYVYNHAKKKKKKVARPEEVIKQKHTHTLPYHSHSHLPRQTSSESLH